MATHKGPADAVIIQVTSEEADAAFGDEGGFVPPAERRVGGRGSTRGIRTALPEGMGGENVEIAPDPGMVRNKIARAAKARARAAAAGQTIAGAPMPERLVQQGPDDGLEDWEREAASPEPQRSPVAPVPSPTVTEPGDLLDRARRRALATLACIPEGCELFVGGQGLGPEGVELIMGLGFLIGKGYAVYRGDGHYRATPAGRASAKAEGL